MVGGGRNKVHCSFDNGPAVGQVCAVDMEQNFGPCSEANGFGYNKSSPCIYLKLNKVISFQYFDRFEKCHYVGVHFQIYNWEPDYYDNVDELPAEMPNDLKETIKSLPQSEVCQFNEQFN